LKDLCFSEITKKHKLNKKVQKLIFSYRAGYSKPDLQLLNLKKSWRIE